VGSMVDVKVTVATPTVVARLAAVLTPSEIGLPARARASPKAHSSSGGRHGQDAAAPGATSSMPKEVLGMTKSKTELQPTEAAMPEAHGGCGGVIRVGSMVYVEATPTAVARSAAVLTPSEIGLPARARASPKAHSSNDGWQEQDAVAPGATSSMPKEVLGESAAGVEVRGGPFVFQGTLVSPGMSPAVSPVMHMKSVNVQAECMLLSWPDEPGEPPRKTYQIDKWWSLWLHWYRCQRKRLLRDPAHLRRCWSPLEWACVEHAVTMKDLRQTCGYQEFLKKECRRQGVARGPDAPWRLYKRGVLQAQILYDRSIGISESRILNGEYDELGDSSDSSEASGDEYGLMPG
jgi:hypothetical protein